MSGFHLFPFHSDQHRLTGGRKSVGVGVGRKACPAIFVYNSSSRGGRRCRAVPRQHRPTWRHRHCFPPRPTLPSQVTKESESLDTDFSPSSDGSLGPEASRRQVLSCRMFQIAGRHLCTSSSSSSSACVRRQTRWRGFLLTGRGCEKFARTSGHMREGDFAVVRRETTGLGHRHNNTIRAQLSIDKDTFRWPRGDLKGSLTAAGWFDAFRCAKPDCGKKEEEEEKEGSDLMRQ